MPFDLGNEFLEEHIRGTEHCTFALENEIFSA